MVQQCPNCLVLVGKLHMRCIWCGIYFCEDCVDPHKHYCPSYQEGAEDTARIKYNTNYSAIQYEKFASLDEPLEEPIQELSLKEKEEQNKEHIVKANLIFQERLRLGLGKLSNECPICKSTINRVDEKCVLCGIKFCIYCVKPEKHKCVIYQYEEEKHSPYVKLDKRVIKPPVTLPELKKELVTTPKVITKSKRIVEPVNELKVQANIVSDSKERETQEEIKVKKKVSIWRKFRSLFGIGN